MAIDHVNSPDYAVPLPGFTHAVTAEVAGATWVFVSGLTARDATGGIQGVGDVAAQTRQVMTSLESVLAEAGAGLGDVVRLVTYLVDITDYPTMSAVRREFFAEPLPAETTVQAGGLYDPRQLVEVEATAVVVRDGAAGTARTRGER